MMGYDRDSFLTVSGKDGFAPTNLPLFHGMRKRQSWEPISRRCMAILLDQWVAVCQNSGL